MDSEEPSVLSLEAQKAVWWLTQLWPFVIVSLAVYAGGEATKRALQVFVGKDVEEKDQPRWYKLWWATIRWHPIMVGGLIGLIPSIPSPQWVPDMVTARVFWYALAGAMSGYMYAAFKDVPVIIRSLVKQKLGVDLPAPADSNPPAEKP